MGGIFVAYHNTKKIDGFQYIPLSEMDQTVFGSTVEAEKAFSLTIQLLGVLLNHVIQENHQVSYRLTVRGWGKHLDVFTEQLSHHGEVHHNDDDILHFNSIFPSTSKHAIPTLKWYQVHAVNVNHDTLTSFSNEIPIDSSWGIKYTIHEVKGNPIKMMENYQMIRKLCPNLETERKSFKKRKPSVKPFYKRTLS